MIEANEASPEPEAPVAVVITNQIDRDPRQPGKHLGIAAEAVLLLKCPDKALLRQLFGEIRIARLRKQQPIYALLIEPNEFVEIGERRIGVSVRRSRSGGLCDVHRSDDLSPLSKWTNSARGSLRDTIFFCPT